MTDERAVAFRNAHGHTLHGILHMPEARTHVPLGVVLLSPGQKCRIGPWRAYVRLARRLAADGVPVLRFDFHGLGDSEGVHEHGQHLVDFNGFVQTGGLASDVEAAVAFFASEAGVRRFVFAGLCGGASTGLIAAQRIDGIYGHVLVDLPVTVSNSARQRYLEQNAAELLRLRPEESFGVVRGYLARVTQWSAWRRLFLGESDYRLLLLAVRRVLADRVRGVLGRASRFARWLETSTPPPLPAPVPAATVPRPKPGTGADETVNQHIIDAFRHARAHGQKLFFLNSSAYHPMFENFFGADHLPRARSLWQGMGLLVVPETNHVLSAEHGQRALFETVVEFVRNALAELAERNSRPSRASHGESLAGTR
jgi:pimeloyl-ACP methyl ester carboxylesterase